VTLVETWRALERLVDEGRCKSIGLSDVSLPQVQDIVDAARIKPAVVEVESHPYLPDGTCSTFVTSTGSSCCICSARAWDGTQVTGTIP